MRVIIVLEGAVGAGKTTLWQMLQQIMGGGVTYLGEANFTDLRLGENCYNPLEKLYTSPMRADDYVVSQLHVQAELSLYYDSHDVGDFTIMDRWIPDCEIFTKIGHHAGIISDYTKDYLIEHVQALQHQFEKKVGESDVFRMYLDTPTERCLANVKRRGRAEELLQGEDYWKEFIDQYRKIAMEEKEQFCTIGTGEKIINNILQIKELFDKKRL